MQIPPTAGNSINPNPGNVYGIFEHRNLLTLKRNNLFGKTLKIDCLFMLTNKRRGLFFYFYCWAVPHILSLPTTIRINSAFLPQKLMPGWQHTYLIAEVINLPVRSGRAWLTVCHSSPAIPHHIALCGHMKGYAFSPARTELNKTTDVLIILRNWRHNSNGQEAVLTCSWRVFRVVTHRNWDDEVRMLGVPDRRLRYCLHSLTPSMTGS
jgi:hypothetical protein